MKKFLILAGLVGLVSFAQAEDQRFIFALPDLDGRISLGVFDREDHLVRTLFVGATIANFTIGNDGLMTSWDGKDDAGQVLPAGEYRVRGYVVGDVVKSEGEAFHFNDWIESEDSPQVIAPTLVAGTGAVVYLAGRTVAAGGAVCSYTEDAGLKMVHTLPPSAQYRGGDGTWAIFATGSNQGAAVNLAEPGRSVDIAAAEFWRGTVFRDQLYLVQPTGNLVTSPLRGAADCPAVDGAPTGLTLLDGSGGGLLVSDGKAVWVLRAKNFEPIPLKEELAIKSLSVGLGDTFWIVGTSVVAGVPGPRFIRQYSFEGELLRELTGDEAADAETITADRKDEQIFITSLRKGKSTVRGLRPLAESSAKVADWEVFLEKSAVACDEFGLVDGQLVPKAASGPPADSEKLRIQPSSPDKPMDLEVKAAVQNGQVWLETGAGLRLLLAGELPFAQRCVISRQKDGTLSVFAGNGAVVAEYRIDQVEQIAEIDAGEIDLP